MGNKNCPLDVATCSRYNQRHPLNVICTASSLLRFFKVWPDMTIYGPIFEMHPKNKPTSLTLFPFETNYSVPLQSAANPKVRGHKERRYYGVGSVIPKVAVIFGHDPSGFLIQSNSHVSQIKNWFGRMVSISQQ